MTNLIVKGGFVDLKAESNEKENMFPYRLRLLLKTKITFFRLLSIVFHFW